MQYSNIDRPSAPQSVRIDWTMETPRDDDATPPDERDEGFWPSRDPGAAGYVLPENFEEEHAKASERMRAWLNDEWEFVGVVAVATISIPIGGDSFHVIELRSAGLWGIESDSPDYLKEVFEDEKSQLEDELKTLAAFILAAS
jgi:hypothetical protein